MKLFFGSFDLINEPFEKDKKAKKQENLDGTLHGELGWNVAWTEHETRTQALDSDVIENGSILILRKSYFSSPEEMIIDQVDGEKKILKEIESIP